jgi:Immunity protein Imm1
MIFQRSTLDGSRQELPPTMTRQHEQPERLTLTASLTTGVGRVTHGMQESVRLVDEILTLDHVDWETTLSVGDVEFHSTPEGPYPNHQLRISVRPSAGCAALNYTDHDDPQMTIANSYNPTPPAPEVDLIFSGATGSVFPRTAVIPIADARDALTEWLETRKRPTCIEWQPYDEY